MRLILPLVLLCAAPAQAQPAAVQGQVEAMLAAGPDGVRYGLLVVDEAGREVVAVAPDQRFVPASNSKLVTTAAAYVLMPDIAAPDVAGGAQVRLERAGHSAAPSVRLIGRGDARLSSAPDCLSNCLAELADAVASRTRAVHDVIGDDSLWPDQRWSPGMSWNNMPSDDGTAVSALNLDDNQLPLTVSPTLPGQPPKVVLPPYYTLRNAAVTGPEGSHTSLGFARAPGSREVWLYGTIPAGRLGWTRLAGIDDPAHYAAWVLRGMLEARGVRVSGKVRTDHRPVAVADFAPFAEQTRAAKPDSSPVLASLVAPPLAEDVVTINKLSQNLHAQALFRRLGALSGSGSDDRSADALTQVLNGAGVPRAGFDLADGSGMSTYNRLSPRATVALLRWAAAQDWGAAWYASFPVAGVDGTLQRRFIGTPLAGNLTAKTGTLNATNALSGRFRAKSGRSLTFAFFANDVPNGATVLATMEAVLMAIYAAS